MNFPLERKSYTFQKELKYLNLAILIFVKKLIPSSIGKVWWQFKNWKLGGITFFIKCTIFPELGLKGMKMIRTTKSIDWTQLVFHIARVFCQRVIYTALLQYLLEECYWKEKHLYFFEQLLQILVWDKSSCTFSFL